MDSSPLDFLQMAWRRANDLSTSLVDFPICPSGDSSLACGPGDRHRVHLMAVGLDSIEPQLVDPRLYVFLLRKSCFVPHSRFSDYRFALPRLLISTDARFHDFQLTSSPSLSLAFPQEVILHVGSQEAESFATTSRVTFPMQKEPSFSRFCQLVVFGSKPDGKLLLYIEGRIIANIILGITFCRFCVSSIV
jgi:hypothetical protein